MSHYRRRPMNPNSLLAKAIMTTLTAGISLEIGFLMLIVFYR